MFRSADQQDTKIKRPAATKLLILAQSVALCSWLLGPETANAQADAAKKPNILILMQDDTGWGDFGSYMGGEALGHPTPNLDRLAGEGAKFTSWYGQASCTAGRASFITGRIPIRTALSVVVAPSDENYLRAETPTIAEYFKDNGYQTYFSGKWHLGDKPEAYPTAHGFDEMKMFAAYPPDMYLYPDTNAGFYPWFPSYNADFKRSYFDAVNLYAWSGKAGEPAVKGELIDRDYLAEFDRIQTQEAVEYIKAHANDDKPFFMDVNFMKMHNPTIPAKEFAGKSRLGDYSDSMLELDFNIGEVMDAIREYAPNTIVVTTADNGAWQDAYPDAGNTPFRGSKGTAFEAGWRVPGIMWWPGKIPANSVYSEMMSHMDLWPTLASMASLTPPPQGEWKDNAGKPIYFDGIDNSQYVLGETKHSARRSWVCIYGESFGAIRVDIAGDPDNEDLNIAWKFLSTAKDTWLGPERDLGANGSLYNLTMDPYERYDMVFTGAMPSFLPQSSPGKWAGRDNAWIGALIYPVLFEFDRSIIKFPSIERIPGGASKDVIPDLTNPKNPVPLLDPENPPSARPMGG